MATPYLTAQAAESRLYATYRIEGELSTGDVLAATLELDRYAGPFIGERYDSEQELAFPRSVEPDGTATTSEDAPDAVLDWVALRAYELSREDEPPVTSRGLIRASVTYGRAAIPRTTRLMESLLNPYQLKVGERL